MRNKPINTVANNSFKCNLCGRIESDIDVIFNKSKWFKCINDGIICHDHVKNNGYIFSENKDICVLCNNEATEIHEGFNYYSNINFNKKIEGYIRSVTIQGEIFQRIEEERMEKDATNFLSKMDRLRRMRLFRIINALRD